MSQRRSRSTSPPAGRPRSETVSSYWDRTHWPLQCLYFLLPLLVLYYMGAIAYAPTEMERVPAILAESLLRQFFEVFGVAGGVYLPGLCLVAVLLGWHVMKRDPWEPEWRLYAGMWVESAVLVAPLVVLGALIARGQSVLAAPGSFDGAVNGGVEMLSWQARMVISLGAGIFEELLFRLIAIAVLHGVLVDLLGVGDRWGVLLAVVGSSVAFALYHFGADDPIEWSRFTLYSVAGAYLAMVYIVRGFGIVVAVHAIYDVVVFL